MSITQSLLAFVAAVGLLTLTPGVDTALVLRASAREGARTALLAALGVALGCLAWGLAVALGLGALLAASALAFEVLKWAGAAYLCWLGIRLIVWPRSGFANADASPEAGSLDWFWRGLFGNLLNPKVGMFYVSFLPQFVPEGVPVAAYVFTLAAIHAVLGLVWFGALVLFTHRLGRMLRRPAFIAAIDRLTGCVFVGFGLKLALSSR